MNRLLLLLCLVFFLAPFSAGAQAPVFSWQKCLGSPYLDYGGSVVPTSDGGSIAVGYVSGAGGDVTGFQGEEDYWAVKQDANGVIQWSICLGGAWNDMGSVVRQLPPTVQLLWWVGRMAPVSGVRATISRRRIVAGWMPGSVRSSAPR